MSDLIDRQDAIEAVCSVVIGMSDYPLTYAYEIAEEALEKLPSAQPVTHEERTETHACDLMSSDRRGNRMDDLISRQGSVKTMYDLCEDIDRESLHIDVIVDALENLPSAEPRKKGKWIDKSGDIEGAWNYCSVCMEQAIDLYDFCPNCGADMREGEEE